MPDQASQAASSQMRELKVSGHTMALDPGLYCIFNIPGSPAAGPEGGLPGVRVTTMPGRQGGAVSLAGFQADGWIGSDSGALVRVAGSAAEVLVTVYQQPDSTLDAPKLQVVRLSGEGSAPPVPMAEPGQQAAGKQAENVEVVAHVYKRGDVAGRLGGWMGEPGSNRWIEGFGISPIDGVPASDIEYQAVLGRGWLSPWSEGGQFCGSRGMSLPILGLRVRLRGDSAKSHRITLSATFIDGTRIGPVSDGDACEAPSLAALEAFQVSIGPAEGKPAQSPAKSPGKSPGKTGAKARPALATAGAAKPARKTAAKPAAKPAPAPTPKAKPRAAPKRAAPAAKRR